MEMKITPVDTLTGSALDWAVVKCEHDKLAMLNIQFPQYARYYPKLSPSTDWTLGGPIIEREHIELSTEKQNCRETFIASVLCQRVVTTQDGHYLDSLYIYQHGQTPLIAAMRCYIASKLGDTVEIPNELL